MSITKLVSAQGGLNVIAGTAGSGRSTLLLLKALDQAKLGRKVVFYWNGDCESLVCLLHRIVAINSDGPEMLNEIEDALSNNIRFIPNKNIHSAEMLVHIIARLDVDEIYFDNEVLTPSMKDSISILNSCGLMTNKSIWTDFQLHRTNTIDPSFITKIPHFVLNNTRNVYRIGSPDSERIWLTDIRSYEKFDVPIWRRQKLSKDIDGKVEFREVDGRRVVVVDIGNTPQETAMNNIRAWGFMND